jgi:hypothetical protein
MWCLYVVRMRMEQKRTSYTDSVEKLGEKYDLENLDLGGLNLKG